MRPRQPFPAKENGTGLQCRRRCFMNVTSKGTQPNPQTSDNPTIQVPHNPTLRPQTAQPSGSTRPNPPGAHRPTLQDPTTDASDLRQPNPPGAHKPTLHDSRTPQPTLRPQTTQHRTHPPDMTDSKHPSSHLNLETAIRPHAFPSTEGATKILRLGHAVNENAAKDAGRNDEITCSDKLQEASDCCICRTAHNPRTRPLHSAG